MEWLPARSRRPHTCSSPFSDLKIDHLPRVSIAYWHCGADISRFQSRRVIDPIADHADLMTFCLQLRNALYFVCGQKFCSDFADASLQGEMLCALLVITGKQYAADAHI